MGQEDPLEGGSVNQAQVFCSGKFYEQRSLRGPSISWGSKESHSARGEYTHKTTLEDSLGTFEKFSKILANQV